MPREDSKLDPWKMELIDQFLADNAPRVDLAVNRVSRVYREYRDEPEELRHILHCHLYDKAARGHSPFQGARDVETFQASLEKLRSLTSLINACREVAKVDAERADRIELMSPEGLQDLQDRSRLHELPLIPTEQPEQEVTMFGQDIIQKLSKDLTQKARTAVAYVHEDLEPKVVGARRRDVASLAKSIEHGEVKENTVRQQASRAVRRMGSKARTLGWSLLLLGLLLQTQGVGALTETTGSMTAGALPVDLCLVSGIVPRLDSKSLDSSSLDSRSLDSSSLDSRSLDSSSLDSRSLDSRGAQRLDSEN